MCMSVLSVIRRATGLQLRFMHTTAVVPVHTVTDSSRQARGISFATLSRQRTGYTRVPAVLSTPSLASY